MAQYYIPVVSSLCHHVFFVVVLKSPFLIVFELLLARGKNSSICRKYKYWQDGNASNTICKLQLSLEYTWFIYCINHPLFVLLQNVKVVNSISDAAVIQNYFLSSQLFNLFLEYAIIYDIY